jgi:hypothetical protein
MWGGPAGDKQWAKHFQGRAIELNSPLTSFIISAFKNQFRLRICTLEAGNEEMISCGAPLWLVIAPNPITSPVRTALIKHLTR